MAPRVPKITRLDTPDGVPDLAAAAGLALQVLWLAGVPTWDEFVSAINDRDPTVLAAMRHVYVTDDQASLMNTHAGVLRHLRSNPLVTVVVCADCGGWLLMGAGQTPASCRMTKRCGSKTQVKAKPARKRVEPWPIQAGPEMNDAPRSDPPPLF